MLHAKGEIKQIKKNLFQYGYYDRNENFKYVGKVTLKNLINREAPLKLLPRYPTHALTKINNLKVFTDTGWGCYIANYKEFKIIPHANSKVVLLEQCPDGGYEIYYYGIRGKVKKGSLKLIK